MTRSFWSLAVLALALSSAACGEPLLSPDPLVSNQPPTMLFAASGGGGSSIDVEFTAGVLVSAKQSVPGKNGKLLSANGPYVLSLNYVSFPPGVCDVGDGSKVSFLQSRNPLSGNLKIDQWPGTTSYGGLNIQITFATNVGGDSYTLTFSDFRSVVIEEQATQKVFHFSQGIVRVWQGNSRGPANERCSGATTFDMTASK